VPYIKPERRPDLDPSLQKLWDSIFVSSSSCDFEKPLDKVKGDINYCMTKLLVTLKAKYGERYHVLSAIAGIARDVEQEFRDIHMRPYEDKKRKENGDVEPLRV